MIEAMTYAKVIDGEVHVYNVDPSRVTEDTAGKRIGGGRLPPGTPIDAHIRFEASDFATLSDEDKGYLDTMARVAPDTELVVHYHLRDGVHVATKLAPDLDPTRTYATPEPKRKFRRDATLADDIRRKVNLFGDNVGPFWWKSPLPQEILSYERMVLDDEALRMAVVLGNSNPREILRMLPIAIAPWDRTWVEFNSRVMVETRMALGGKIATGDPEGFMETLRTMNPDNRTGLMFENRPGDILRVRIVENTVSGDAAFEWPLAFDLAVGENRFKKLRGKVGEPQIGDPDEQGYRVVKEPGRGELWEQACRMWGYETDMGQSFIRPLIGRAQGTVMPHWWRVINANDEQAKLINHTLYETSGLTRFAVAMLALLNTTVETSPPEKPKGRRIVRVEGKMGSVPYLSRTRATLVIPRRVRAVERYVRDQIKDEVHRKRLHRVKWHYRHLPRKPKFAEGWTECSCPFGTPGTWHKRIDAHFRGDERLGVVEHDVTVVRGMEIQGGKHGRQV